MPKIQRVKNQPMKMHVLTPDGVNTGGSCIGCGANLQFWFHYKMCERCLMGMPVLRNY